MQRVHKVNADVIPYTLFKRIDRFNLLYYNSPMSDMNKIYAQVPPGYYFESLRNNILQRFWHEQRFKQIRQLCSNRTGTLLDIGCADGVFTNVIYNAMSAKSKITGIDIYKPSITFAHKKYPYIRFMVAAGEKIPFPKASFNYITCLEMLEHVASPSLLLNEMRRILKKNGTIIIMVPHETWLFKFIWFIWTKSKGKVWDHAHLQHFDRSSMTTLFTKNNFKIIYHKTFLLNMLMLFEITP